MSFTPISASAYKFKTFGDDDVFIGDTADSEFHPKFSLTRWNNECVLKSLFDDSKIPKTKKSVKFENNQVIWDSPDFTFKFYPVQPKVVDGIVQNELGGLELEIILKTKPNTNKFSVQIETQNLEFIYQPPLTEWEKANGFIRPENVVGSYAVYHKTKNGVYINKTEADKYKCGKAFHIYRPKLIDAKGNTAWADLDISNNVLTIILPQAFLNVAVYPVVVDPTFGYETKGASSWSNINRISATRFASGGTGTGVSMTAYIYAPYASGYKTKFALYDGNNLVSATEEWYKDYEGSFDDWKTLNFPTSPTIANQDYKLCLWQNQYGNFYYDSSSVNQWSYQDITYDGWPNPANFSTEYAYKFSIYCTYTSGAVLKEVSDTVSLSDSLLRDKTFSVSDSIGLTDVPLKNWTLQINDAVDLLETVLCGRLLQVLDLLGLGDAVSIDKALLLTDLIQLSDNAYVDKVLAVSDGIALVEVVEKGVTGAVRTKIFLVLGDVAIQLTGG